MLAQRTMTISGISNSQAAVREAVRLLEQRRPAQRWVCEACGMVHTGTAPAVCDSCGLATKLVQQADLHRELNSRW